MTELPSGPFESKPIRLLLDDRQAYEVQVHRLPRRGTGGAHDCLRVFYTCDAQRTWSELGFRLNWRSWLRYVIGGSGGDCWPPRGEDVFKASIRNGKLVIRYGSLFQSNNAGKVMALEATYSIEEQRWSIADAGYI